MKEKKKSIVKSRNTLRNAHYLVMTDNSTQVLFHEYVVMFLRLRIYQNIYILYMMYKYNFIQFLKPISLLCFYKSAIQHVIVAAVAIALTREKHVG